MNLTFGECSDCVHRDLCIHESAMDSVRTKINNIVEDSNIKHNLIQCVKIKCTHYISENDCTALR